MKDEEKQMLIDPYSGAVMETMADVDDYVKSRLKEQRKRTFKYVCVLVILIIVASIFAWQQIEIKKLKSKVEEANTKYEEQAKDLEKVLSIAESYQELFNSNNNSSLTLKDNSTGQTWGGSDYLSKKVASKYQSELKPLLEKYSNGMTK